MMGVIKLYHCIGTVLGVPTSMQQARQQASRQQTGDKDQSTGINQEEVKKEKEWFVDCAKHQKTSINKKRSR